MFEQVAKHMCHCAPFATNRQLEDLIHSAPEGWPLHDYLERFLSAVLEANKSNTNWEATPIFNTYMNYTGFFRDSAGLCREVARDRRNPAVPAMIWLAWLYREQEGTLDVLLEIFRDQDVTYEKRWTALQLLIVFYSARDDVVTAILVQLDREHEGSTKKVMWELLTGEHVIETHPAVSRVFVDAPEREAAMRQRALDLMAPRLG